ncbi:acyltransferase, partial [Bacillus sp. JJ634]
VVSIMGFIPRKQYFFTNLGKNTLYIYLLHGFFIKIFRESQIQNYFENPEHFILLAGISLLLTLLLSDQVTISFTQPLIELKLSQLKLLTARVVSMIKFYRNKFQSR